MIIGITGGIGSGKSVISKELRRMGYPVYDTDKEAKRLILEDAQVRQQIMALFGPEAYKDGVYQTAFLAEKVFTDTSLLAQLNAIVHPAVKTDILRWVTLQDSPSFRKGLGVGFYFVECAILYQAGFDALCDKVVAVTAPKDIRLARVIARDHSNIDKVRARMRAQRVEQDIECADIIINNDGTTPIPTLCQQILEKIK